MNYYNEWDKHAAAWLRELIKAGLIPNGDVDERSIKEVQPKDLDGYTQCHFFAGIGGWPYALRLAGWPEDREVWTGSCPCQPYSAAGKGLADADERNLWPEMFRLVKARKPSAVFGEQVEAAIRHGWLDGISTDLEGEGYEVGAHVLGAHSVGAQHIRQRLYWVADAGRSSHERGRRSRQTYGSVEEIGGEAQQRERGGLDVGHRGEVCGLGQPFQQGLEGHTGNVTDGSEPGRIGAEASGSTAKAGSPWNSFELLPCTDGKSRRIPLEPEFFPLAHGIPGRMGLLRGYGNAIVPQVAEAFIRAYMEI